MSLPVISVAVQMSMNPCIMWKVFFLSDIYNNFLYDFHPLSVGAKLSTIHHLLWQPAQWEETYVDLSNV